MKVTIHHYHHDASVPAWAKGIMDRQEKIMASIADALAAVHAADTRVDSVLALLAEIKKQLADALAGVTLPPAVQAQVDEILSVSTADAAKIDTALNANAPPAG